MHNWIGELYKLATVQHQNNLANFVWIFLILFPLFEFAFFAEDSKTLWGRLAAKDSFPMSIETLHHKKPNCNTKFAIRFANEKCLDISGSKQCQSGRLWTWLMSHNALWTLATRKGELQEPKNFLRSIVRTRGRSSCRKLVQEPEQQYQKKRRRTFEMMLIRSLYAKLALAFAVILLAGRGFRLGTSEIFWVHWQCKKFLTEYLSLTKMLLPGYLGMRAFWGRISKRMF